MARKNRAFMSGLFLVVLISATVSVIYWLGHLDRERNTYIVSTRASVSGLNPESTVFYRGIAVGKVLEIKFDPTNTDTILIKIEVDKNIVLSKGVFATLHLKGVTGLTQLDLDDAEKIREKLQPGELPENRIPLMPSVTDRLLNSGDELLKKADHLMNRLSSLLNEENESHFVDILANLKNLSGKLADLQRKVDEALTDVPALTQDARSTLKNIDQLVKDLRGLSAEAKMLATKIGKTAESGQNAADVLTSNTLPNVNVLLFELQNTTVRIKKLTEALEHNPQSVLLGPSKLPPGPGEPGYEESK